MQTSLFGEPSPPQDADIQPNDVTTAATDGEPAPDTAPVAIADLPSDVIAEPPPRSVPTPPPGPAPAPPADAPPPATDAPATPTKPTKRRAQHAPDKDEYNADQIQVLGSVVIFTVIPAKAGIQRPLAANAYLPATGFRVPAFAGMTETDAWRPIFLN